MLQNNIKNILTFIAIAIVTGLSTNRLLVWADARPADLSALPKESTQSDATGKGATASASAGSSATAGTYDIKDWGIKINLKKNDNLEIGRHRVLDGVILFETKSYDQLRLANPQLTEGEFRACVMPLLTVARIKASDVSINPKATPWWKNKHELDTHAKKIGDYYYYVPARTTTCKSQSVSAQIYPPLTIESNKLMDWMSAQ